MKPSHAGLRSPGFSMLELILVLSISIVVAGSAVPIMGNTLGFFRLSGDARAVSNATAVAKMRAAALFTQTRLYVDLGANTFRVETWQKTGTPGWHADGGTTRLSAGDAFGFGSVTAAPANTQATIAQAPACLDASGEPIPNTACVVFNSRGIPIDASGAATALDAIYLSDGTGVYGVTVSATGLIALWRTSPTATPAWTRQ